MDTTRTPFATPDASDHPERVVVPFPPQARPQINSDAVLVWHAGEVRRYPTPRDLHRTVLEAHAAAIQAQSDAAVEAALAAYRRTTAAALEVQARRDALLGFGIGLAGAIIAVLVFGL